MNFKEKLGDWIEELNPSKIIVLDTETTGVCSDFDEILQVSIIDGYGETLLDSYVKPTNHTSWKSAEEVNHISPTMVKTAPTIEELQPKILEIVNNAEKIITYNGGFDLRFLKKLANVSLNENQVHLDMMYKFASYKKSKWLKLTQVSELTNFKFEEEDAHNSLGDVKATLWVYYFLKFGEFNGYSNYYDFVRRNEKEEFKGDYKVSTNWINFELAKEDLVWEGKTSVLFLLPDTISNKKYVGWKFFHRPKMIKKKGDKIVVSCVDEWIFKVMKDGENKELLDQEEIKAPEFYKIVTGKDYVAPVKKVEE